MNYYNEHDPKAAAWLRELIKAGEIPPGDVDERSIVDVQPTDLVRFSQCHFFAGIGGWSYALKLAGWPSDKPVWTGSCPCQPYSTAGQQKGDADARNLWPAFFRLIRECGPDVVFGEQVKNAIGHGWLDGIQADLERENYAVGHCVLGAHSVGAPHIRQRLYWVANAICSNVIVGAENVRETESGRRSPDGRLEHSAGDGWEQRGAESSRRSVAGGCGSGGLGDTNGPRPQGRLGQELPECPGEQVAGAGSAWSDYQLIPCRDGKSRRIESGSFPLAHGVSGRVAQLRGLGNAIVPQVAAEFIQSFCEIKP